MRTTATSGFSLGPEFTNQTLQKLIIGTAVASLSIPFLDVLIGTIFKVSGIQLLLSLTWNTISHLFLWQPFTHLFIMQSYGGIHLGLVISVAFRMYILWIIGSSLIDRFGVGAFFRLYFGGGILTGIALLGVMAITGFYPVVVGNTASLFTIFTVWAMMNPDGIIYLFFVIPIQVKWLLAGIVGANLFINLSEGDPIGLTSTIIAIGFGYIYATTAWGLHTPFPFTYKLDRKLSSWGDQVYDWWHGIYRRQSNGKIYDINKKKDEAFVDAMLEKISKHGENSLWFWERWRLRKISKRNDK